MEKMSLNEIRKQFLDFFESKDHYVRASYSLVPENDKSLLLINAGMAPLKNYFMGTEIPPKKRMSTCQKCIRTGDIENVGKTARHATFFEMLGNFSFGDYFKNESIAWGWEFVTKYLKFPVEKLWVTVYEKDDEAYEIWEKKIGIDPGKIVRLGKEDNFWEIGVGPCGPCSEIYYDRGEKYGCGNPDCKPGCECDRYIEFWNHVFTQFDKDENGNYNPLPNPNIDTGMGLERMACIMQGVDSIFEIDTIKHILNKVLEISGQKYGQGNEKTDVSIRIVTDHIRSVTFMVCDGIMPSNEGRGYVLRRLLRRAARHGKLLGIKGEFLTQLVDSVLEVSSGAYPELLERKEYIKKVITIEEERFQETIDQGSEILKGYMEELKGENKNILSGENAFRLYDTYGFPLELTKEILEEENMTADEKGFKAEMEKQRERARNARRNNEDMGWKEDVYAKLDENIKSQFKGYKEYEMDSKVIAIVKSGEIVEAAQKGDEVTIILDETPFYPEGGGQVGDHGVLFNEECKIKITACRKNNQKILHIGEVLEGKVFVNGTVKSCIDIENRMSSARNHTATHLLQAALRNVLGNHVEQSGSLVTPERLRFDFTHFQGLTEDELEKIEKIVNQKVLQSLTVLAEEMGIKEAKKKGATALFGEKYGEVVRVVTMGDYSIELCGGTHLNNTSQVGLFKIISEGGVAAGIRRIEAVTGHKAYEYINQQELKMKEIAQILKSNPNEIVTKVENLVSELRVAHKEVEILKNKLAKGAVDEILATAVEINNIKVIRYKLSGLDMDSLRKLGDQLKDKLGTGIVVLATEKDNKGNFIAMATEDAVKKGIHAGNMIRQVAKIAGGGGGGKPTMAQAGAKDVSKIDEALEQVMNFVKEQVK
ncbi:alanine--tRNA ligase [Crassaminicella profunda]|uniref:alanine--tRNA ligase n=1 Tax=Crassaminicella profunda TaxID=1286698 RepID=UPI001CA71D77|nr:alanine--tRNA ligase [Crassaminicella profunda]QZY57009.1 alanine--tRNA ligase [Crassaminicella profunda]